MEMPGGTVVRQRVNLEKPLALSATIVHQGKVTSEHVAGEGEADAHAKLYNHESGRHVIRRWNRSTNSN
jgi:hypothetical protein